MIHYLLQSCFSFISSKVLVLQRAVIFLARFNILSSSSSLDIYSVIVLRKQVNVAIEIPAVSKRVHIISSPHYTQ
jgi:hypothetical protein